MESDTNLWAAVGVIALAVMAQSYALHLAWHEGYHCGVYRRRVGDGLSDWLPPYVTSGGATLLAVLAAIWWL